MRMVLKCSQSATGTHAINEIRSPSPIGGNTVRAPQLLCVCTTTRALRLPSVTVTQQPRTRSLRVSSNHMPIWCTISPCLASTVPSSGRPSVRGRGLIREVPHLGWRHREEALAASRLTPFVGSHSKREPLMFVRPSSSDILVPRGVIPIAASTQMHPRHSVRTGRFVRLTPGMLTLSQHASCAGGLDHTRRCISEGTEGSRAAAPRIPTLPTHPEAGCYLIARR
ncbi:hypothetical protein LXA43DRAFT_727874 [Ganoderma leucocontextum]|nr:hypothetical protein LXA43DRAFT_727874 [Ganoderma leucocontextum]